MRLVYTRPRLKDLSVSSRITFARQFRLMSQDEISDKLGITFNHKLIRRYKKILGLGIIKRKKGLSISRAKE